MSDNAPHTAPLRVVHLLSNKKWTERSEPAADLVLGQLRIGCDSALACGRWTAAEGRESSVEEQARRKGLAPELFRLDKHFRWGAARRDVPALRRWMAGRRAEVAHVHMANAHLLAACAVRGLRPRPLLVASSYEADGTPPGLRAHVLYRCCTDGVVTLSARARRAMIRRYGLAAGQVEAIEPGIDTERFDPVRPLAGPVETFGLDEGHLVLGVVSRLRRDRRIDLAVDALARLADAAPRVRLLIVGHGEDEESLRRMAAELGVAERVVWAGYCRHDRLVAAYRAMDALVYPVPGTDPSCRTVREAMASGVPVLATRTGFLTELVEEGQTGRFIDLTAESLAAVARELAEQAWMLRSLKATCLEAARRRFPLRLQAERTVAFYRRLLAGRDGGAV